MVLRRREVMRSSAMYVSQSNIGNTPKRLTSKENTLAFVKFVEILLLALEREVRLINAVPNVGFLATVILHGMEVGISRLMDIFTSMHLTILKRIMADTLPNTNWFGKRNTVNYSRKVTSSIISMASRTIIALKTLLPFYQNTIQKELYGNYCKPESETLSLNFKHLLLNRREANIL